MNTDNIDQAEVNKFTNDKVNWWDTQGPMRFLHTLNPIRLSYLLSQTTLKAKSILDIGCGAGIFAEALAKQNSFVTAIDLNESALDTARNHSMEQGLQINYQQATAESMAKSNHEAFDIISCMEMLEHVPDPSQILSACATMVKPGGLVIASTLNRTVKSFLGAIVAAEYIMQLMPKGTHEYKKFIRPSELVKMANQSGLTLHHIQGVSINPLTQQMQLSPKVDINYIVCFQKHNTANVKLKNEK